ncbi:MAG: sensor histidine kinase [Leadbetterella sp.]
MFAVKYRYIFILVLGIYSFVNIWLTGTFRVYNITVPIEIIFGVIMVLSLVVWEGNRLISSNKIVQSNREFWIEIGIHFLKGILVTGLFSVLLGYIVWRWTHPTDTQSTWQEPVKLLTLFAFRINLFLNCLNVIFLYQARLKKSFDELENFKRLSSTAQLETLKSQVNPHFLFNNLSVLSALIPEDTQASLKFVKQFSDVYRYVLQSSQYEIIELEKELSFCQSYIHLIQTRFPTGFQVSMPIDQRYGGYYIVPLSLQMLIENVVKHNKIGKKYPIRIEIYINESGYIVVKNNIIEKRETEPSTQFGLNSINERCKFVFEKEIKIISNDLFFEVWIPLSKMNPMSHRSFEFETYNSKAI